MSTYELREVLEGHDCKSALSCTSQEHICCQVAEHLGAPYVASAVRLLAVSGAHCCSATSEDKLDFAAKQVLIPRRIPTATTHAQVATWCGETSLLQGLNFYQDNDIQQSLLCASQPLLSSHLSSLD